MIPFLSDGLSYLEAQSFASFFALFWYVLVFELPRYTLSFAAAAFLPRRADIDAADIRRLGRISMLIAGHNEEQAIDTCVRNLAEQSLRPDEVVVVSDGSTDQMPQKLAALVREGLVDRVHCTDLRAGKAAAINLAERLATGDFLINIDCDCSFDRQAVKRIMQPFADPRVGVVAGNLLVRNPWQSLLCTFQAIEYLISISLGKAALGMIGQVSCASGAFSAFRRTALDEVGGLDAGGGEDLDVTLRLRKAGWGVEFAADAIATTSVPVTVSAFIRQRLRWERDAVRLRYRKHGMLLNPFSRAFRPTELFHEIEFLVFNVIGSAMLPVYFVWLLVSFGDLGLIVLVGAQVGILFIDTVVFLLAAFATPQARSARLIPYIVGYSLFNGFAMRFIRLAAYTQEWVYRSSYRDSYVPAKVHNVRR